MAAEAALDTTSQFGSRTASLKQYLIWRLTDHPSLPAGLRRRLRKRFANRVFGPFDITHDEMKFRLYPAENHCDRVLFGRRRLPERREHDSLVALLVPGMVFVDIGANIGSYSIFVGTQLKGDANLLCFEPHPRTREKLLYNLRANALTAARVIGIGVGPEGEAQLWSSGGTNIGNTSLLKEGTAGAKHSVTVHVAPLQTVLKEQAISKIDLLKIDIEGYEDRALAPFFETAPPDLFPKHILIETAHSHLWEKDLLSILDTRGYRTIFSTAENLLLEQRTA